MSKKTDMKPFEIPVEGSLGILALGAVGIRAWKKKRQDVGYDVPNTNFMKKKPEELKAEAKKKAEVKKKEGKKK
jgi:hypothetical protein